MVPRHKGQVARHVPAAAAAARASGPAAAAGGARRPRRRRRRRVARAAGLHAAAPRGSWSRLAACARDATGRRSRRGRPPAAHPRAQRAPSAARARRPLRRAARPRRRRGACTPHGALTPRLRRPPVSTPCGHPGLVDPQITKNPRRLRLGTESRLVAREAGPGCAGKGGAPTLPQAGMPPGRRAQGECPGTADGARAAPPCRHAAPTARREPAARRRLCRPGPQAGGAPGAYRAIYTAAAFTGAAVGNRVPPQ
jgi:hypothetical protein